jgi:hypothetical protein
MKHTPTPYEVYHESSETYVTLPAGKLKARAVARVFHLDPEQRRVDAEFIATACNNHGALLELVRGMLAEADRDTAPFIAARQLLKGLK